MQSIRTCSSILLWLAALRWHPWKRHWGYHRYSFFQNHETLISFLCCLAVCGITQSLLLLGITDPRRSSMARSGSQRLSWGVCARRSRSVWLIMEHRGLVYSKVIQYKENILQYGLYWHSCLHFRSRHMHFLLWFHPVLFPDLSILMRTSKHAHTNRKSINNQKQEKTLVYNRWDVHTRLSPCECFCVCFVFCLFISAWVGRLVDSTFQIDYKIMFIHIRQVVACGCL